MGWDYCKSWTKNDVIKHVTSDWKGAEVSCVTLDHKVVGNVVWMVKERTYADGRVEVSIDLALLDGNGYKLLSECEHPYFYNCPLEFLDKAPVANAAWRKIVTEKAKVRE